MPAHSIEHHLRVEQVTIRLPGTDMAVQPSQACTNVGLAGVMNNGSISQGAAAGVEYYLKTGSLSSLFHRWLDEEFTDGWTKTFHQCISPHRGLEEFVTPASNPR